MQMDTSSEETGSLSPKASFSDQLDSFKLREWRDEALTPDLASTGELQGLLAGDLVGRAAGGAEPHTDLEPSTPGTENVEEKPVCPEEEVGLPRGTWAQLRPQAFAAMVPREQTTLISFLTDEHS